MTQSAAIKLPPRSDTRALVLKKRKRNPNRALTEIQIRVLFSSIDNIRDDALIRLGLSVGLRVSEVVNIRASEIDFDWVSWPKTPSIVDLPKADLQWFTSVGNR